VKSLDKGKYLEDLYLFQMTGYCSILVLGFEIFSLLQAGLLSMQGWMYVYDRWAAGERLSCMCVLVVHVSLYVHVCMSVYGMCNVCVH
jgi:hypothetical protein